MFFQSIRFKIVLWYMLILSLTLFAFSLILYHNFHHKLSHDMNDLLSSRAQGVVSSIETYWDTENLEANQHIFKSNFLKQDNINFIKMTQRWVNEKNDDPKLINLIIRIFDAQGLPISTSKDIPMGNLPKHIFQKIHERKSYFEDTAIDIHAEKSILFRTYTTPVFENNKLAYIVQVASPLTNLTTALRNLSFLLLLLLPTTVILTGLAGIFLVKLTLKPVHEMIETIHQITAENLSLRINLPHSQDEIEALAKTFNNMINRLEESFRSQQQFMQDISHELKTPLSILKGELEVTLKKARSAQEYENTLHSNLDEINKLTKIVENLLMLAKFDTKTITLNKVSLNLDELIGGLIEDIRVLADQKQITLKYESKGAATIEADKDQIRRLVLNLLDNAIKYTPNKGEVSVSLNQVKDMVTITISDDGIGIPENELPNIFNRFYRVDKSRHTSGFGLGLSITQSIVIAHQGTIQVKNNPPTGTQFIVSLPLASL